jgi:DNA (cytosine-5)-methyltransferase 1
MDVLSKEQRSKNMRAIRSSKTKIEDLLAKALWSNGLRYRRNDKSVYGKPDFVFKTVKVAVFCDSEFFHGKNWDFEKYRIKTNSEFWRKKIYANINRDRHVESILTTNGWKVLRFWGGDIKKKIDFCVREIKKEVENRKKNKHMQYSVIRDSFKIVPDKAKDNALAYFTHYLQNSENGVSQCFKKTAIEYFKNNTVSEVEEPTFQYYLPITWDVPFPPISNPRFKFIDLFAGIGGFRISLQNAGGKCVFSSEIDRAAKKTYESNFGEVPFGDIKEFTSSNVSDDELDKLIPDHDILAAGFPCQPFSLAGVSARNYLGKEHGFNDDNQGNLFFDILRIVQVKKPNVLFLENVKNLKSHDKGKTFKTIEELIRAEGYEFYYAIINSQTEVPQRRERTYMVCFKGENHNFIFPNFEGEPKKLKDILELNVGDEYTISDKLWEGHQRRSKRNSERGTGFTVKLADLEKPSNTIVARYYKDGKECLVPQKNKNPRKLTPRECARLQGYPESFLLPKSNTAAYKQFGNSVSVPVIQKISNAIVKKMEEYGLLR